MGVNVFVWLPKNGNIGHTSIGIRNYYLSFWPGEGANFTGTGALIPSVGRMVKTMIEDFRSEGNRIPDKTVDLNNLDEEQMIDFYVQMETNKPTYWVRGFNCATVVKIALWEGSKIKPAAPAQVSPVIYDKIPPFLSPRIDSALKACWSPFDVLKYANHIKEVLG